MKNKVFALIGVVAMFGSTAALAQDHTRGWEPGYVVQVTEVDVHDGMFNAYVNDLGQVWRKFLEQQIEDGVVVRYSMYANPNARDGEPDLYLTVTFPNWAAFDTGIEYFEELSEKIFGSLDDGRVANINRGELRTIGSTYNLREIKFKD